MDKCEAQLIFKHNGNGTTPSSQARKIINFHISQYVLFSTDSCYSRANRPTANSTAIKDFSHLFRATHIWKRKFTPRQRLGGM